MSFLKNLWTGRNKIDVEIVIKSAKANYHIQRKGIEKPDFKEPYNNFDYNVRQEGFYKKPRNPLLLLFDLFRGVKARYIILFWEGEADFIEIPDAAVAPLILERVRTSRILGKALKELFKDSLLGGRGIIFIVIIFVAVAIFVLRTMGYIS